MKLKDKVSYSAVAAAVAIACGNSFVPVANAATIGAVTTITMSQQGNALATSTLTQLFSLPVTIERDYAQSDNVRINLVGGSFPTAGVLANAVCVAGTTTATFGALAYETNAANFRSTSTPNPTSGQTCTFNVNVLSNSMATASNVSLSFAATTAGGQSVESSNSRVVGRVIDQYGATVGTALNGQVNVNNNRLHFTADDGTSLAGNEDALTVTFAVNALSATAAMSATATRAVMQLVGDFSFLDDDGTAGCVAGDLTGNAGQAILHNVGGTGTLTIDAACTTLTYTETAGFTGVRGVVLGKNAAASATAATNEKIIAAPQTFTGSVAFSYNAGALTATTTYGIAPGAFSLNGFSTPVSYVPYGTGRSRILWIANRSTQAGAVTFTAVNDAGVACAATNFPAVTAAANAVTQLAGQLDAGIAACYGATFAGRVAFTVTANVPSATAELYSAFNNNGDIAVVVNQSNGFGTRN